MNFITYIANNTVYVECQENLYLFILSNVKFIESHEEGNNEEETAVESAENDTTEQGKYLFKIMKRDYTKEVYSSFICLI